jgi:hypothetical protein
VIAKYWFLKDILVLFLFAWLIIFFLWNAAILAMDPAKNSEGAFLKSSLGFIGFLAGTFSLLGGNTGCCVTSRPLIETPLLISGEGNIEYVEIFCCVEFKGMVGVFKFELLLLL